MFPTAGVCTPGEKCVQYGQVPALGVETQGPPSPSSPIAFLFFRKYQFDCSEPLSEDVAFSYESNISYIAHVVTAEQPSTQDSAESQMERYQ